MYIKNVNSYDEFKLRNEPQKLKVTLKSATKAVLSGVRAAMYPTRIVVDVASHGASFVVSGFKHKFRILDASWAPARTAAKTPLIANGVSSASDKVATFASNLAAGKVAAVSYLNPVSNIIPRDGSLTFKTTASNIGGRFTLEIEPW